MKAATVTTGMVAASVYTDFLFFINFAETVFERCI